MGCGLRASSSICLSPRPGLLRRGRSAAGGICGSEGPIWPRVVASAGRVELSQSHGGPSGQEKVRFHLWAQATFRGAGGAGEKPGRSPRVSPEGRGAIGPWGLITLP